MNWKLIFGLSLFGLVVGAGSWFGWGFAEPLLWLGISIMCAWVIAVRARANYFLHGLLVGLLCQVWVIAFHAYYLFDVSRNKPEMVEVVPWGLNPQLMNLMIGLGMGVITGVITGLLAVAGANLFQKEAPAKI